jgi:hypothetical protein
LCYWGAGLLQSHQFPINYFTVSEVEQRWEDFADVFGEKGKLLPGPGGHWRFNRIHDYGDRGDNEQFRVD